MLLAAGNCDSKYCGHILRHGVRLIDQGHISLRDLPDKLHVWLVEHNMEVLYGLHGFQ